jgi:hypothetical protein
MHESEKDLLDYRLARVERALHICEFVIITLTLGLTVTIWIAFRPVPTRADDSSKILRVRGLVVEDASGRARILLGAPAPMVKDRKRTDEATGMIVLGENGVDRVAIGYPTPAPQVGGKVAHRIASLSGIQINDLKGDERSGYGILDSGTVMLGLDYPGREAVALAVTPQSGFAGLIINAPQGSESERAEIAVLKDGTSLIKFADTTGTERAMLLVQDESPAKLLGISPKDKSTVDVGVSWLNPSTTKHVVVGSGEKFMGDIGNLKP